MNYLLIWQVDFFFKFILFIYFWLHWVFIAACGLSLVAARGEATLRHSAQASHCGGLSCCGAWALGMQASAFVAHGLQSTGSVVVVHGPNCSVACGILPDPGPNPCPLHWQADSQPLSHQGSPTSWHFKKKKKPNAVFQFPTSSY